MIFGIITNGVNIALIGVKLQRCLAERYLKSLGIEKVRSSLERFSNQNHDNINSVEIEDWKSGEIEKAV